jgi:CBS domain-containing protein
LVPVSRELRLCDGAGAHGLLRRQNRTWEAVVHEPDVASVMTTPVIAIATGTPFKEIVQKMSERGVSALPVVDDDRRLVGVVSEADMLAKQEFHGGSDEKPDHGRANRTRWYRALAQAAGELMTSPVHTVPANEPVSVAARILANEKVRRVYVLDDDGRLSGVVARRDLLSVYLRSDDALRADIEAMLSSPAVGVPERTVGVTVHNGMTTVDGVLPTRRQADVVSRAVLAVPGVVGVRNNLRYVVDERSGDGGPDVGTDR